MVCQKFIYKRSELGLEWRMECMSIRMRINRQVLMEAAAIANNNENKMTRVRMNGE